MLLKLMIALNNLMQYENLWLIRHSFHKDTSCLEWSQEVQSEKCTSSDFKMLRIILQT